MYVQRVSENVKIVWQKEKGERDDIKIEPKLSEDMEKD